VAVRRPEFVARQSACPSGLLGRLIGHVMARETVTANETALGLLDLQPADHVLEVGFGHGATIARVAAAVSRGFVAGVDPSPEMCRMAARRNRQPVASGSVELRQASVEALPFPDDSFDKVLSVHTLYFWPDLFRPFAEIQRALKPGGRLVVAYRSDPAAAQSFPAPVYRFRGEAEVEDALRTSAFSEVRTLRRPSGDALISFTLAFRSTGSR
jgi:ubiquinone/menaquinone biosynthesis C-methylase UbiE